MGAKRRLILLLDAIGFRRYGHNELDEPSFTNPLMYKKINELGPPGEAFARQLIERGKLNADTLSELETKRSEFLSHEFSLEKPEGQMTHLGECASVMVFFSSHFCLFKKNPSGSRTSIATRMRML